MFPFFLPLLLSTCAGVIIEKTLTASENFFASVTTFAYADIDNATFSISARQSSSGNSSSGGALALTNSSLTIGYHVGYLLLCETSKVSAWVSSYPTRELSCELGLGFRLLCFEAIDLYSARDVAVSGTINRVVLPMRASLVLQQCLNPPAFQFDLVADLRNGDSHLDAEDIAMPRVFLVVASVYGVVSFCWFALWRFHGFRFVWVHTLVTVALVCKSVALAVALWYWSAAAYSGDLGRIELFSVLFVDLIQRVTEHSFLFVLAKGFGVTRRSLRTSELRAVVFMTAAMAGSMLAFDFDDRGTFNEIETVARLSTKAAGFVAAGVALKFVQIDLTHIIRELAQHLQMIGAAARRDRNNRVVARYALMKALRIVIMTYYALFVVAHLVVVLSLNELEWWERLMCECVEFLLFISLLAVLRPRSRAASSNGALVLRKDQMSEKESEESSEDEDDDDAKADDGGDESNVPDIVAIQLPPVLEPFQDGAVTKWRMLPRIVVGSDGELQQRLEERRRQHLNNNNERGDE
jgi:hypothetical protein